MKKPIIGIIAKHKKTGVARPDVFIRDEVEDAIFYNGGVAIGLLSPSEDITCVDPANENVIYNNLDAVVTEEIKQDFILQINLCNGIILQGGGESDAYEMWIAKYCHQNNIPILAICAGFNNLVRGIGGSVKMLPNPQKHNQPNAQYVHNIRIKNPSKFYDITRKELMLVNSRHKNTIDNPAGLEVVAYDDNSNIEVALDPTKKFFMGMRFHPESLYKIDEACNNIFKAFIAACKNI